MRATRALVLAACALVALPAAALDVNGLSAGYQWTAATGPVAGYELWISRNGAAPVLVPPDLAGTQAAVSAADGDTLILTVRAYSAGKATFGPFSPASDPATFHTPLGQAGKPSAYLVCAPPQKVVLTSSNIAACQ